MLAVTVFTLSSTGVALATQPKPALGKRASVPIPAAWNVALKAHPDKIVKQELRQGAGGSGLRHTLSSRSSMVERPANVICAGTFDGRLRPI